MLRELAIMNEQLAQMTVLQNQAKKAVKENSGELKEHINVRKALNLTFKKQGQYLTENNKLVDFMGREISRVGEVVTNFNKRTTVLGKTIEKLNKEGKSFEVFSPETLREYKRQGGNTFEFLAEAISGTREEITILGQEGAKIRRFAYGFLPSGTFSAINKFASVLQALGSFTRRGARNAQNYTEQIKTLKKELDKTPKNTEKYKEISESIKTLSADMKPSSLGSTLVGGVMGALGKLPTFESMTTAITGSTIYRGRGRPRATDYAGDPRDVNSEIIRNRRQQFGALLKPGGIGRMLSRSVEAGKERRKAMKASLLAFYEKTKDVSKTFAIFGKGLAKALFKFVIMASIYITIFFALIYAFRKPIVEGFKFMVSTVGFIFPLIKEGFMDIYEGFIEIYKGIMEGDLVTVLGGFWEIIWGVLQVSFGIIASLVGAVVAFIAGVAYKAFMNAVGYVLGIFDSAKSAKEIVQRILVIALVIGAFFATLPVIVGAVIVGSLIAVFRKTGLAKFLKKIPFFANGGVSAGGLAVVGERGPELVNLPRGSRVHSNSESKRMSGGNVFNITINARDTSKAEMRRMADEIGRMINSKINRSTSSSTLR